MCPETQWSHVEWCWEHPVSARFLNRLASTVKDLVAGSGLGFSDPPWPEGCPGSVACVRSPTVDDASSSSRRMPH
jgi:hypothetical protein